METTWLTNFGFKKSLLILLSFAVDQSVILLLGHQVKHLAIFAATVIR